MSKKPSVNNDGENLALTQIRDILRGHYSEVDAQRIMNQMKAMTKVQVDDISTKSMVSMEQNKLTLQETLFYIETVFNNDIEDCIGQGFQRMNVFNARVLQTNLIKEVLIALINKHSNK